MSRANPAPVRVNRSGTQTERAIARDQKTASAAMPHRAEFWTPSRLILAYFVGLIVAGSVALLMPFAAVNSKTVSPLTAFFEATSAVCVTGLVRVDTGSTWSGFGQAVLLILMQFGGLGFASSSLLVLMAMRRRPRLTDRLALQTAIGTINRRSVVGLGFFILKTTFFFEGIGAALLFTGWVGRLGPAKALWWAIFHSVSAFTNASFDITGTADKPFASLTGDVTNPIISLTIPALIICGGIGFVVFAEILDYPHRHTLSVQTRVVLIASAVLLVGGTLFIWLAEHNNPRTLGPLSLPDQIIVAFFHSAAPRTAGFNTIDLPGLHTPTLALLLVLMFIGGGSNSTAGGLKVGTAVVILASVRSILLSRPNVVLFKKTIPPRTVAQALAVCALYSLGIAAITFLLTMTESLPPGWLLFETTSAFGTVGMTLGATPHLSDIGAVLIAVAMFVGRLGPIVLLVAFSNTRHVTSQVRRPEEDFAIS